MRHVPAAFVGRCAIAVVEITAAAALLTGSVVVGHDLRAWRAWYGDPRTAHPWAPTPTPSLPPVAGPAAR